MGLAAGPDRRRSRYKASAWNGARRHTSTQAAGRMEAEAAVDAAPAGDAARRAAQHRETAQSLGISASSLAKEPQEVIEARRQVARIVQRIVAKEHPTKIAACFSVLEKLLSNVLKEPANEKFRTVRFNNPALKAKLFSIPGAVEVCAVTRWTAGA
eukprot:scaffold1970_cov396-Prasinococcus_capsulatus_cf.AAC.9